MQKFKRYSRGGKEENVVRNYAAIDLGTNSCRLVIASPTPTSFHIIETFSRITRLGEGIIKENELGREATRRTIKALKICSEIISEYAPIFRARFVATAACRRAKNCKDFLSDVKRQTGLNLEIISSQEESRLAVIGCMPLSKRNVKRALVFDIGGGSTEITLARLANSGKAFIEGFVSLPYGVVTVSEAFPNKDMTNLAYNTIMDRTHKLLESFEERYKIGEAIANGEIQVIGTSGTVTVLGAIQLNLQHYNRSAVDGISITAQDMKHAVSKIRRMGDDGRKKHPCIGPQKADLTIAGCAIIEAICSFWPVKDVTVADRGIREGILLDMMHNRKKTRRGFMRRNKNKRMNKDEKNSSGSH